MVGFSNVQRAGVVLLIVASTVPREVLASQSFDLLDFHHVNRGNPLPHVHPYEQKQRVLEFGMYIYARIEHFNKMIHVDIHS
jgi:hypothetical protein